MAKEEITPSDWRIMEVLWACGGVLDVLRGLQKDAGECVKEKSRKFVDSYFSGNGTNAMMALLQSLALTDEQIKEREDICDRVCIQSSGRTAHEYGLVPLKTLKLLRSGSERTPPAVTYMGEKEFARRMGEIAGFRPYRKKMCVGMSVTSVLVLVVMLLEVHTHSYVRYNESKDIMVGNYDSIPQIISYDTEELSRIISYDDRYVYVEKQAFEKFLEENDAGGEIWIVFGGFYKLPDLAGAAEA